jgi:Zn-dependent metalloprotease
VHTNGGITSHAAYLVAQALGGDVRPQPVEHIWYRAPSVYLTENSDFGLRPSDPPVGRRS